MFYGRSSVFNCCRLEKELLWSSGSKKWKNFTDHFVRERKKKKKPSGEKGPPFVSRWPYFVMLTFLDDTVRHRA